MSAVITDAQSAVRCKKKLSSPHCKYYVDISLEKLRHTTKHLPKRAENWATTWTRDAQNMSHECYLLYRDIPSPDLTSQTAVQGSSPRTAVKQPWAWSVLGCVTVWEQTVLLALAGTAICYRLVGTRDSISGTRRLCWMRKRERMHKRSKNGTGAGIAVPFLCLSTFKYRHIQRHIQNKRFKRYVGMMVKCKLLSSENVTPWSFVNCYQSCDFSRVCRGIKEVFALLGCYTLHVGSCTYLPTYSA